MTRTTLAAALSALALGGALLLSPAVTGSAHAETDACAGQSWPNESQDCIDQKVKQLCRAGGGGSACDSSATSGGGRGSVGGFTVRR